MHQLFEFYLLVWSHLLQGELMLLPVALAPLPVPLLFIYLVGECWKTYREHKRRIEYFRTAAYLRPKGYK